MSAERDLAIARAVEESVYSMYDPHPEGPGGGLSDDRLRAIIAQVDASLDAKIRIEGGSTKGGGIYVRGVNPFALGGDDRASDGEQNAEAGNLAPASPVVHPTPPSFPELPIGCSVHVAIYAVETIRGVDHRRLMATCNKCGVVLFDRPVIDGLAASCHEMTSDEVLAIAQHGCSWKKAPVP
jgi:hypothetical protein